MDLAVRTTASPAAIWAIVIVAVVCLAFWLAMVLAYATRPDPRHRRVADMPGPVLGGIHLAAGGRSVAPTRDASAVLGEDVLADLAAEAPEGARVPGQRQPQAPAEPVPAAGAAGTAEAPAEPIPAQRTAAGGPTPAGTTAGGTAPADTAGPGAGGHP